MEAQYALQKKKPLIPLMLVEGYEADGWLGLLLGTSMWYGFYGETLSSASGFDGRMDALCREIGSRGRADAVGVGREVSSANRLNLDGERLREDELCRLRVGDLLRQARHLNVSEDDVLDAQDSDDVKSVLIALVTAAHDQLSSDRKPASDPDLARKEDLMRLPIRELLSQAKAYGLGDGEIEEAQDDSEDPKAAVAELLLLRQLRGKGT
jgi:hypothetical protein